MVILMDEAARYKDLQQLELLARTAGINNSLIATTPQPGPAQP
jgi:hypothetical protein